MKRSEGQRGEIEEQGEEGVLGVGVVKPGRSCEGADSRWSCAFCLDMCVDESRCDCMFLGRRWALQMLQ